MYKAEFALMIGGSRESLETYIHKLSQNNHIDPEFFGHFRLIQLEETLWIFAFCHHSFELDKYSWSNMRDESEFMDLCVFEKILDYAEQEASAEKVYVNDEICLDDDDIEKPLNKEDSLK